MKKSKNADDKKQSKIKVRKNLFILLSITILLFSIYKISIIYQLKTQVVAVVRFEFNGLENMFRHKYEYYAITKHNKSIRISRNDMNKYKSNYSDKSNIYELEKDNTYMLSCFYGQIREDDYDFNLLSSNEKKNIEAQMNKIYKILQDSYGEDYFILYTDKNNYIVENDSNSSSTIYRYEDEKLIRVLDIPNADFYYIYFIK